MKQVGFAARLLAVAAVLALAAFVVSGCGGDKSENNSSGGGSTSSSSTDSGSNSSGPTKNLNGQKIGSAKKVIVKSDQNLDANQQAVIARIGEFGDATEAHNYKKLCNDLLSAQARKIGGDCVGTFSKTGAQLKDFNITVNSVKVASDGKTAVAKITVDSNVLQKPQQQNLGMIKEDGDWRVQILGQ